MCGFSYLRSIQKSSGFWLPLLSPSSAESPYFPQCFQIFFIHFPALTHQYVICIIESDNTKGQVSNMANEKLKFVCDYMEGAHPAIMNELLSTNMMQTSGYGLDEFSESARDKIRKSLRRSKRGSLSPRGRHPDKRYRDRRASPLLSGRSLCGDRASQSMRPVPSNSADIKKCSRCPIHMERSTQHRSLPTWTPFIR